LHTQPHAAPLTHTPQTVHHGRTMGHVISGDGTRIEYERLGQGPALILVDGAMCSRAFGPMPKLAPLLARQFTVFMYDRRGRGGSGDTQPYTRERELEDLAALMEAAGGSAALLGLSSGAALALEAAAGGLPVTRVAAYEPPYVYQQSGVDGPDHLAALQRMLANNERGNMVTYFMKDMVNVPGFVVVMMRVMFWMWPKLKAVAHTLPYDTIIMDGFRVPSARLARISVPTLLMHGGKGRRMSLPSPSSHLR